MILHLKPTESHSLRDYFRHISRLVHNFQKKIIKNRRFRAPKLRMIDFHHIMAVFLQGFLCCLKNFFILRQGNTDFSCLCSFYHKIQIRFCKGIVQQRLYLQIRYVYLRYRIQVYVTIQTGKSEKVLILTPTAAGPFEYLRRQFIFSLAKIWGQFKFRRGKGIFTVTHKLSVQPQRDSALRSLKRNKNTFSFHCFRNLEIFHIACHRIKLRGNLSRLQFFSSLPGILHVGILGNIISLHLNMRRNTNIIPGLAAVLRFFKSRNGAVIIFCIVEFPQTIQAETIIFHILLHLFHTGKIPMI